MAVICEILDEGRDYISPDICQQLGLKKKLRDKMADTHRWLDRDVYGAR